MMETHAVPALQQHRFAQFFGCILHVCFMNALHLPGQSADVLACRINRIVALALLQACEDSPYAAISKAGTQTYKAETLPHGLYLTKVMIAYQLA